jgi:hypothetical protein
LTLDPGWKNSDPGYGINIPDPQLWKYPGVVLHHDPGYVHPDPDLDFLPIPGHRMPIRNTGFFT